MKLLRSLLAIASWLAASLPAHAVMPPYYEARAALERIESADRQRARAEDVVVVRVSEVHSALPRALGCPTRESWEIRGEVVQVLRGTLKPGRVLKVEHGWDHYDCPGPVREPTPVLKPGMETTAFLKCSSEGLCAPAAGPMSFISVEAFAREWERRKEETRRLAKP